MKFKNNTLVVSDIQESLDFYKTVLGLQVVADFDDSITLIGGIVLQTRESWAQFIQKAEQEICFQGNDAELYFEEDDFDVYLNQLKNFSKIHYVHALLEQRWGQRIIRFYDPDGHIIAVAESLKQVCRRFLSSGLSEEETAKKMDVPLKFVHACLPALEKSQ